MFKAALGRNEIEDNGCWAYNDKDDNDNDNDDDGNDDRNDDDDDRNDDDT